MCVCMRLSGEGADAFDMGFNGRMTGSVSCVCILCALSRLSKGFFLDHPFMGGNIDINSDIISEQCKNIKQVQLC